MKNFPELRVLSFIVATDVYRQELLFKMSTGFSTVGASAQNM